jgi:amidase
MDELRVQLANLMQKNNAVALLYPHQKCLPVITGEINQTEGNGMLALLAGFPAIVLPAGLSKAHGSGVGQNRISRSTVWRAAVVADHLRLRAGDARKPPQSTPPPNDR